MPLPVVHHRIGFPVDKVDQLQPELLLVKVCQHRLQFIKARRARLHLVAATAMHAAGGTQILAYRGQDQAVLIAKQQGRTQFIADFFGLAEHDAILFAYMLTKIQIRPIMDNQCIVLTTRGYAFAHRSTAVQPA